MNKRGTHVDWAISMGIFLVYVLSMFVLIQPGIQKFYKEDNLMKVIEDGMNREDEDEGGLFHTMSRVPVFVMFNDIKKDELVCLTIGANKFFDVDMPTFYKNLGSSDNFNVKYWDGENEILVPYKLESQDGIVGVDRLFIGTDSGINCAQNKGLPHIFYLYYNPEGGYDDIKPDWESFGSIDKNSYEPVITPGTLEEYQGISPEALNNFACANGDEYRALKEKWNFPINKEFAIYYVESAEIPYDITETPPVNICNSVDNVIVSPPDQTDVYVKEFSYWILGNDNTLTSIIMNVRIW